MTQSDQRTLTLTLRGKAEGQEQLRQMGDELRGIQTILKQLQKDAQGAASLKAAGQSAREQARLAEAEARAAVAVARQQTAEARAQKAAQDALTASLRTQSAQIQLTARMSAQAASEEQRRSKTSINALENEQRSYRNMWQARQRSNEEAFADQARIQRQALEMASALDRQSDAYRRLTQVAAAAQRTMDQSQGFNTPGGFSSGVSQGILSALGNLGPFGQLLEQVVSAGMQAAQDAAREGAQDVAREAGAGLRTGLMAQGPGVTKAAADLGDAVEDGAKRRLDIRSPSRVMRRVGEQAGDGLADGLKSKQAEVAAAAKGLADTVERNATSDPVSGGGMGGAAAFVAPSAQANFGKVAAQAALATAAIGGTALAVGGLATAFVSGTQKAVQYEQGLAELSLLTDKMPNQMGSLGRAMLKMSVDTTTSFGELKTGLSELQGASVKGMESDAAALETLAISANLAKVTLSDVGTSADALSSVLNAYGMTAADAGRVSDQLWVSIRAGKVDLREIAGSLGAVASQAASLDVPLEQLLGAMATLTTKGIPASTALEYIRSSLSNIQKPSKEAQKAADDLGIAFDAVALKRLGLIGFLDQLGRGVGDNSEAMATLIGDVGGLNAVLGLLAGGMEGTNDIVKQVSESAGSLDRDIEKLKGTAQNSAKEFIAAWDRVQILFNTGLLPTFTKFLNEGVSPVLVALGDLKTALDETASPQEIKKTLKIDWANDDGTQKALKFIFGAGQQLAGMAARGEADWQNLVKTLTAGELQGELQRLGIIERQSTPGGAISQRREIAADLDKWRARLSEALAQHAAAVARLSKGLNPLQQPPTSSRAPTVTGTFSGIGPLLPGQTRSADLGTGLGSSDSVARLRPEFIAELMKAIFQYSALRPGSGLTPYIHEGYRSNERQNALYAQGRTAPGPVVTNAKAGQSLHNYGAAADIYWKDASGKVLSFDDPRVKEAARVLGQLASKQGLLWGGSPGFGIVDMPHIQENISWQAAAKKYGGGPPPTATPAPAQKSFDTYAAEARRILAQIEKYAPGGSAPNGEKWAAATAQLERFGKAGAVAEQALAYVRLETKKTGGEVSRLGADYDRLKGKLDINQSLDKLGRPASELIKQLAGIRSQAEAAAAAEEKRNGKTDRYKALLQLAGDAAARLNTIRDRKPDRDLSPFEKDQQQQRDLVAQANMVKNLRAFSGEQLAGIVKGGVTPEVSLAKWKAAGEEIERRVRLREQREKDAASRSAQLAKDRAALEAQLGKDLSDGDRARAQATVGRLQQNLDTQLSLYRDNAGKRLEVEQQLGPKVLAAQKRVLEAERDAAIQSARDTAAQQRTAQAKIYGGEKKIPQGVLDRISRAEQQGISSAETVFNTKISQLYSAQQERLNRATAAVQAKSRQVADQRVQIEKEVTQQLAQQDAAQRQATIQAERDKLSGLEGQQRTRVAAAKGNAAALLQVEKDLGGKIREQQQRVALAQLVDAKRTAEEARARALAAIPKGATEGEAKRLRSEADATFQGALSSAYRTYSLAVGKAAQDATLGLAAAQDTLSDKVRTLRGEYAQLAEGMREKIAAGKVEDADLAGYLKRLDDLGTQTRKAGLSSNTLIQGAQASAAALYQAGIDAQIASGAYSDLVDTHDRASRAQAGQTLTLQDLISALPQSADQVDGFRAALQDLAQKGQITNQMMEIALLLIPDFASSVGTIGEASREVEERLEAQGGRLDAVNEQYEQGLITGEDYGQQLEGLAESYTLQAQAAERLGQTDVATFFRTAAQTALDLASGVGHITTAVRELQEALDQAQNNRLLQEGIASAFQGDTGTVLGNVAETFTSGAFGELDDASRKHFLDRLSAWLPTADLRSLGQDKLRALLEGLGSVDGAEVGTLKDALQGAVTGLTDEGLSQQLGNLVERAERVRTVMLESTDPAQVAAARTEYAGLVDEAERLTELAADTSLADVTGKVAATLREDLSAAGERLDTLVDDQATTGLYAELGDIIERAEALKAALGTSIDPVQLSVYQEAVSQLLSDTEALAERGDGEFASRAGSVVSSLRDEVTATASLIEQVIQDLGSGTDQGSAALEEMLAGVTQELEKAQAGLENGTLGITDYNDTVTTQREVLDRLYARLLTLGPAYAEAARSVDLLRKTTSGMTVDAGKLADALREAELAGIRKAAEGRNLQYQAGTLSAGELGQQTGQDVTRLTLMAANLERMGKAGAAAEVRALIAELERGLPTLGQAALKLNQTVDARSRMNDARGGIAGLAGGSPKDFALGWNQQVEAMREAAELYPELGAQIDRLIGKEKLFKGLNMANHYLGIAQAVAEVGGAIAGALGQDEVAEGLNELAGSFASAQSAVVDWAKVAAGDLTALPGAIMNSVTAIDKLLAGIQALDPAYRKWKKNQLELASLQRESMGQKKYNSWLENPYYDALAEDAANREKVANARPLQKLGWWLFGNAPQVMSDEAAKAQAKVAGIFNDFASGLGQTLEQSLLDAAESGEWGDVGESVDNWLQGQMRQIALRALLAKSNLKALLENLSEEVARGGDTTDEVVAINSEVASLTGQWKELAATLGGEAKRTFEDLGDELYNSVEGGLLGAWRGGNFENVTLEMRNQLTEMTARFALQTLLEGSKLRELTQAYFAALNAGGSGEAELGALRAEQDRLIGEWKVLSERFRLGLAEPDLWAEFGQEMMSTVESELLRAWQEGDWKAVDAALGAQLEGYTARVALKLLIARSQLQALTEQLMAVVEAGGDTTAVLAAIRAEQRRVTEQWRTLSEQFEMDLKTVYDDFGQSLYGAVEQALLGAWENGDFEGAAGAMRKQLDRFVAQVAAQTLIARSGLKGLVEALVVEGERGGDTGDELAAIRAEQERVLGQWQRIAPGLSGYGAGREAPGGGGSDELRRRELLYRYQNETDARARAELERELLGLSGGGGGGGGTVAVVTREAQGPDWNRLESTMRSLTDRLSVFDQAAQIQLQAAQRQIEAASMQQQAAGMTLLAANLLTARPGGADPSRMDFIQERR